MGARREKTKVSEYEQSPWAEVSSSAVAWYSPIDKLFAKKTTLYLDAGKFEEKWPASKGTYISGEHSDVMNRLNKLETEISEIKQLISEVNNKFHEQKEIIELKDVSRLEAKQLIKQYFENHHSENMTYSDLFEALKIDIPLIIELCDELVEEGKIAEVEGAF